MSNLLKPNDNGLASLDEVRAWMEAQTRETIEEKIDDGLDNQAQKDIIVKDIEYISKYRFFGLDVYKPEEWRRILEQERSRPILISEMYDLARRNDRSPIEEIAFKEMKRVLRGRVVITHTRYNSDGVIHDKKTALGVRIVPDMPRPLLDEKKIELDFLVTIFGTDDDEKTIRDTFKRLTRGDLHLKYAIATSNLQAYSYTDNEGMTPLATYFSKNNKSILPVLRNDVYACIGVNL